MLRSILPRVLRNPSGAVGLAIAGAFVLLALAAPWIAPHSPLAVDPTNPLAPPSAHAPFGTDEIGRDIFSRVIFATRPALEASIGSVALGGLVGILIGATAGYFGGVADAVQMRVIDALFGIPIFVFAFILAAVLGPSLKTVTFIIALGMAPTFARLARGEVVRERELEYVAAIRSFGSGHVRLLRRHILPNIAGPLVVQVAFALAVGAIFEGSLSFLGLGVQDPNPSWGTLMYGGRQYLSQSPLYGIMPGVFLTAFAVGMSLLGEGLRSALSVRESTIQG